MSTQGTHNYEYHLGGCLPVDAPSYVTRKADEDLYESLMAGHYCYALNSRQMGKSSLRVRTWHKLRENGVDCATVDISGISTDGIRPADWYFGVAYRLGTDLGLFADFSELVRWWQDREPLPPAQRLADYIEVVLLERVRRDPKGRIVVFVDEIDSLFKLEFGDDFFDLIRNCHGKRAIQDEYAHLTFVFMGVADPSDLIKDKHRPPFNIGEAISLSGFKFEEARQSLATGLATKSSDPDALLLAILDWTDGQPFLTQKICDLAAKESSSPEARAEASWVSKLIREQIVDNWEAHDTPVHFRAIRDRILQNKSQRTGRLLGLYQRILREEELEVDSSLDQMELRLSGLVVVRDRKIRVSNPIYRAIFDEHWTQKRLSELRPYGEMLEAWLESGRADDSRLLRGQALLAANEWAAEKKLSDDDYEFLAASEKLEKAGIQNALNIQEEEKNILFVAKQRADKRIRIGGVILALSLIIAAGAVVLGVTSVGRARAAQRETVKSVEDSTRAKAESSRAKADLDQTQNLLKNAGNHLDRAQADLTGTEAELKETKTELGRITPELSRNRTELATSKSALLDLQATLRSTENQLVGTQSQLSKTQDLLDEKQSQLDDTKNELSKTLKKLDDQNSDLAGVRTELDKSKAELKTSSEKLKGMEISLENKPFETYLAAIEKARDSEDERETEVYVKTLVGILKSGGPQYENRVATIRAHIKESKNQGPEATPNTPREMNADSGNWVYESILYKGTGDARWKAKIFDSCRQEARTLASSRENGVRFQCRRHFRFLSDLDAADSLEITQLFAELILNYDLSEVIKDDVFDSLSNMAISERNSFDIWRKKDSNVFLDLVKIARNNFRTRKGSFRASGARDFLRYGVWPAYWIYTAQSIAQSSDIAGSVREGLGFELYLLSRFRSMYGSFPESDDPRAWKSWLARNSKSVSLWDEPELTTLRNHPEILEAQLKLWR